MAPSRCEGGTCGTGTPLCVGGRGAAGGAGVLAGGHAGAGGLLWAKHISRREASRKPRGSPAPVVGRRCWGASAQAGGEQSQCWFLQETPVPAEDGAAGAPRSEHPREHPSPCLPPGVQTAQTLAPASPAKGKKEKPEPSARCSRSGKASPAPTLGRGRFPAARGGTQMARRGTAPAQGSGWVRGLMSCAHGKPEHL